MTERREGLRFRERIAIRLMIFAGLAAVGYWSFRLATHDFAEPQQIAVVGHDAPWRRVADKTWRVYIGTHRRHHDIVLYDRKASPSHLYLERRGGAGRWWSLLTNRSPDREIGIERFQPRHEHTQVNRYRLRHGDRFLVPVAASAAQARPTDSCSPTQIFQWMRQLKPPAPNEPQRLVAFAIEQQRFPLRPWHTQALLQWGKGASKRQLWLDESHRYTLPKAAGGGILEYRHGRWHRQLQRQWQPLQGQIRWGSPTRTLEIKRRPQVSFAPLYSLGLADSSCRWPLRPGAIPAGIEVGGIARLAFVRQRLVLQHLGQQPLPLQIVPRIGAPRRLGTAVVYSGDFLTLGQLTYRIYIDQERVRMMLTRPPTRYLFPLSFFADYPSRHLPMRRRVPDGSKSTLLLTGGEGNDTQTERWHIPLSLAGTPGKTQIRAPYSPFLSLQKQPKLGLTLTPQGEAKVYQADATGKLNPKPIAASHRIRSEREFYYTRRLYLQIFRPSYLGLGLRIGIVWFLVVGGLLWWLGRLLLQQRIPLRPVPQSVPFANYTAPSLQEPKSAAIREDAPQTPASWRWLFPMLLLPAALFLNGLGLFVLATLSLSSLGLNNNTFLYRQFLWSLVGVGVFVLVLSWSRERWKQRWQRWTQHPRWQRLLRLWPSRKEQKVAGVRVMGVESNTRFSWSIFAMESALWLSVACALALTFRSWSIVVPVALLFGYVVLLRWEWKRSRNFPSRRQSMRYFFLTLLLLGLVPLVGLFFPPLVHNRFFLIVPGAGTIKLSEFAILAAILFFAQTLGVELFALRLVKARKFQQATSSPAPIAQTNLERDTDEEAQAHNNGVNGAATPAHGEFAPSQDAVFDHSTTSETPAAYEAEPILSEASHTRHRIERIGGALSVSFLYLLLLGAIGLLYTAQGDLGPGLILTLCFSLYLLFAFLGSGADRLTTFGNLSRIALVFFGLLLLVGVPSLLASLFPEWTESSSQLQKVQERLALWHQPWRFLVGEQILQNLWNLARYKGAFQWFNNLHSDFVFTAVVGVLSPAWGGLLLALTLLFPLATLGLARLYWHPISPYDPPALLAQKQRDTVRSLILLFCGIYLFAQNFIHIGSVLRLTPMTGVTFSWISSGGTSLVACYFVLALLYRQLRIPEEAL